MCGIIGAFYPDGRVSPRVDDALASISHRGPDARGFLTDTGLGLGMCRLAVIDLATGDQPIANEDGRLWVMLNGEIYNHRELRDELIRAGHQLRTLSDTEVIVHLYEEHGTAFLDKLDGMFALAVWDTRARELTLARDRFGEKPLYYVQTPQGLLFASELKGLVSLASAEGIELQISDQAIYDFLSLGTIPQPRTVYRGVCVLGAGTWMRFSSEGAVIRAYWAARVQRKVRMSYSDAVSRTRELVRAAVRSRLEADVPVGVLLSGGIDSAVVAAEASACSSRPKTFTVGVDDPQLDERHMARETARMLGCEHTELSFALNPLEDVTRMVDVYDQPYADSSALVAMAVCREARKHVTVVLTGDGGDEIFGGYRRYLAARASNSLSVVGRLARTLESTPIAIRRRAAIGFALRYLRGLGLRPGERYLIWTSDMLLDSHKRTAWQRSRMIPTEFLIETVSGSARDGFDDVQLTDIQLNLQSDLLVKMDLASMSVSLEARAAYLDARLFEFAMSLEPRIRMRRWRLKSLLRDAYRDQLPASVVDAPKRGFEVPMERWLRSDLRPLVSDLLGAKSARVKDYLDHRFVDSAVDGRIPQVLNRTYLLFSLLMLELWLRRSRSGISPVAMSGYARRVDLTQAVPAASPA